MFGYRISDEFFLQMASLHLTAGLPPANADVDGFAASVCTVYAA